MLENTPTVATTDSTLLDTPAEVLQSAVTPEHYVEALDPASTPPSTDGTTELVEASPMTTGEAPANEESGTQQNVQDILKLLAHKFPCVEVKKTEQGAELFLFTQTKVAHPTFVDTLRKKLENKEDVGKNYILAGGSIEEILLNLDLDGL